MKIIINTAENGYVVEVVKPNRRGGNTHQYHIAPAIWELRNIIVELCEQDQNDEDPN